MTVPVAGSVAAGSRPARGASGDAALVRRVRWRLLAWSAGSTLLVLLALGVALYLAVASSLRAEGLEQLERRGRLVVADVARSNVPAVTPLPGVVAQGPTDLGVSFLGPATGTLAFVIGPNDPVPDATDAAAAGLVVPEATGLAAARAGQRQVVETTVAGTPVRVLSIPFDRPDGRYVLQVLGDRTAELRALNVLLVVLLLGGVLVMAAALGVGWVYADRALVPIRDAMRRQREFAADASHELRTPLAIVRGSLEHLRRHRDAPVRDVGDALDDMDAEVRRLEALVGDLLLLARTDSGEVEVAAEPVELAEVALDASSGLARIAEPRGVRVEVDAEPVEVTGDPGRLRQLVTILGDNAIRHSPPRSHVRVGVHPQPAGAVLTVDDDGPGFAPHDLPRVFDRFWRAPGAPGGGTGLGLAIASWIVERHGGRIRATNRPSRGARLEVVIPRR